MSLVEATIILMVMSLLTAVIAPSIRGYVSDAQQTAAKKDVEAIAAGVTRMLADVGESWFVRNGARTGSATHHGAPSHAAAGTRVDMLVSSGTIPQLVATARVSGTDWDDAVDNAAIQTLDNYLVLNAPSGDAVSKAYRTGSSLTGTGNFDPDDGQGFNAEHGWRGAYLTGPSGPDPWGERYAANVEFLARTQGTTGSGSRMDVIVISAGVNNLIETQFEVDGQTTSTDDIIAVVSGGTR